MCYSKLEKTKTVKNAMLHEFRGISIGNGTTLEIADYYDRRKDIPRKFYSNREQVGHWCSVSVKTINKYRNVIGFLDRSGYLFYLPSFIWHCIDDTPGLHEEVFDSLCRMLSPDFMKRILGISPIELFSQNQRDCIVISLEFIEQFSASCIDISNIVETRELYAVL